MHKNYQTGYFWIFCKKYKVPIKRRSLNNTEGIKKEWDKEVSNVKLY